MLIPAYLTLPAPDLGTAQPVDVVEGGFVVVVVVVVAGLVALGVGDGPDFPGTHCE